MLELDDVNLVDVAHRVVEATRPLAEQRDVRIVVRAPDHPCLAQADVRRVERIVRNLVTNAIDHARREGETGTPEVVVLVAGDEQSAAIAVRDYGVGLAPGEASMVFNRFWRADPARARTSGGTGLGLSISQEDAHLHGGWLQAWGRLGEGSQFRLTLPRLAGGVAAPEPAPARARRRPGAGRMTARDASHRRARPPARAGHDRVRHRGCPTTVRSSSRRTTGSGNQLRRDDDRPARARSPASRRATIVKGFLDAMQATPIRDDVAREFLADSSRRTWNPDATIIYDDISLPQPSLGRASRRRHADRRRPDRRPRAPGRARPTTDLHFSVGRRRVTSYRIALPKDTLIVPRSWYTQRFRQVSLYFFDPTSKVLVPDPVFVPRGVDLASILVQRLIAGPSPDLVGYSRNLLPEGVDPDISVPVSDDGVATVDLGDVAPLDTTDRELLVAQLAWTLRQDTSVERAAGAGRGRVRSRRPARARPSAWRPGSSTRRTSRAPTRCSTASTTDGWSPAAPRAWSRSAGRSARRTSGCARSPRTWPPSARPASAPTGRRSTSARCGPPTT